MIKTKNRKLIIGTRGSELALAQTKIVIDLLRRKVENIEFIQKVIRTSGDEGIARPSSDFSGKDAFTREIDNALVGGKIDLAVHSLKDVPNDEYKKASDPPPVELAAFPVRESPFDVLISKKVGQKIDSLPTGARIGTSSVRRRIQLESYRPDFRIVEVHGNVPTRIKKLRNGDFDLDAIVLAEAGLNRLGAENEIAEVIPPVVMLPAVGQGCLAVAVRSQDAEIKKIARSIDDYRTRQCILAERRFSREFGGGCNTPLAALATMKRGMINLEGMVARSAVEHSPAASGDPIIRVKITGPASGPNRLGRSLSQKAKSQGARK